VQALTRTEPDERGEIVVDARGHRCPVPTLRLRRTVEGAPPGAVVRLLADDPLVRIDAPHFAAEAGLDLLDVTAEDSFIVIRIRIPDTGMRRAVGGNDAPPEDFHSS
jgi:tRNA 2-thiouridine synthesizing protein A